MQVRFQGKKYQLVITDHARERMEIRDISENSVLDIIENGESKEKPLKNKFWVFKKIGNREGNICLSISVESPNLIVITALLNWRPEV